MSSVRVLVCLLLALHACPLSAQEYGYALRAGRGLAVHQRNAFASKETAEIFEYTSYKVFPNVTHLRTVQGGRVTVDARRGGYLLMIPFPGKGEARPEEALAVIRVAEAKFPQFASSLRPLKEAWRQEQKVPPRVVEAQMATREHNKQLGEAFQEWLRGLFPKRQPPAVGPSLLGPSATLDRKEKSTPKTQPTPDGSEADDSLEKNLETIQKYYETNLQLAE